MSAVNEHNRYQTNTEPTTNYNKSAGLLVRNPMRDAQIEKELLPGDLAEMITHCVQHKEEFLKEFVQPFQEALMNDQRLQSDIDIDISAKVMKKILEKLYP